MIWRCSRFEFDTKMPIVMGILNVTPDSFSDGGTHADHDEAVAHALCMVEEGAQIVDVGGESTRSGAEPVSVEEEKARTIDVVRALAERGLCVSIDTRHAEVARAAVEAGASIVNDVSGFRDPAMVDVARSCDAGLVVVHMQGEPGTMQENPTYDDVVVEVRDYLVGQAALLEQAGVARDRICLDPGPGFGKTPKQTLELVRNLHELVRTGYPVMAALSRKSYIGYAYHIDDPAERDRASAAEALMACELGASVVRTHNVAATVQALKDLRPFVLLGLGCNVALVAGEGEEQEAKKAQLNHAIGQLCALPDSQIVDISSFYESEPAYYVDQEPFVNAVVLMRLRARLRGEAAVGAAARPCAGRRHASGLRAGVPTRRQGRQAVGRAQFPVPGGLLSWRWREAMPMCGASPATRPVVRLAGKTSGQRRAVCPRTAFPTLTGHRFACANWPRCRPRTTWSSVRSRQGSPRAWPCVPADRPAATDAKGARGQVPRAACTCHCCCALGCRLRSFPR